MSPAAGLLAVFSDFRSLGTRPSETSSSWTERALPPPSALASRLGEPGKPGRRAFIDFCKAPGPTGHLRPVEAAVSGTQRPP